MRENLSKIYTRMVTNKVIQVVAGRMKYGSGIFRFSNHHNPPDLKLSTCACVIARKPIKNEKKIGAW